MTEAEKTHSYKKETPQPRVVIVGGGFGGLYAARALAGAPVSVTLIDRRNYHLFRPPAISSGYWLTFGRRDFWSAQVHTRPPKQHRRSPGRIDRCRYAEARCSP